VMESSLGSRAAALLWSGVRLTVRAGPNIPAGLADRSTDPACSGPGPALLLLALSGVCLLRGADVTPASTDLPCRVSPAPADSRPAVPLLLLEALKVLRMLLLCCNRLAPLQQKA